MDNRIKECFIKVLKEIIDGDLSSIDKWYGLCGNLSEVTICSSKPYCNLGYNFVENNCSDWKHYSGLRETPIIGFNRSTNWQGEQLKLRQSLAQHLLTKLEESTYVL